MPGKKHIHKYHKINLAGHFVFACALSDCSHYIPKHIENLIIGKKTYCWECDLVMTMGLEEIKMDRPICVSCRTKTIELPIASNPKSHISEATLTEEKKEETNKTTADILAEMGIKV